MAAGEREGVEREKDTSCARHGGSRELSRGKREREKKEEEVEVVDEEEAAGGKKKKRGGERRHERDPASATL